MSRSGHAIADKVDALIQDVDAPFLYHGAGEDVVSEEGRWVGRYIVVHHFEIDGIFFFHGRNPTRNLLAIPADIKNPIVSFTGKSVGRRSRRDWRPVDGDRRSAGKGAETRINHTTNAIDVDCEEHVRPYAFVAGFED